MASEISDEQMEMYVNVSPYMNYGAYTVRQGVKLCRIFRMFRMLGTLAPLSSICTLRTLSTEARALRSPKLLGGLLLASGGATGVRFAPLCMPPACAAAVGEIDHRQRHTTHCVGNVRDFRFRSRQVSGT